MFVVVVVVVVVVIVVVIISLIAVDSCYLFIHICQNDFTGTG